MWLHSEFLRCDAIRPNVGPQDFRNGYTAIGLLVILDDGYPGASGSPGAAVERVHKFCFPFSFPAKSNVGPTRLVGFEVRTGRDLAKDFLARKPDFQIVGFRRCSAHVAGAQG